MRRRKEDYTPADLDAWLDQKVSDLIRSTSEIQSPESDARAFIRADADEGEDGVQA